MFNNEYLEFDSAKDFSEIDNYIYSGFTSKRPYCLDMAYEARAYYTVKLELISKGIHLPVYLLEHLRTLILDNDEVEESIRAVYDETTKTLYFYDFDICEEWKFPR